MLNPIVQLQVVHSFAAAEVRAFGERVAGLDQHGRTMACYFLYLFTVESFGGKVKANHRRREVLRKLLKDGEPSCEYPIYMQRVR